MKKQNYSNHIRFYVPHHFIFYSVMLILISIAIRYAVIAVDDRKIWIFMASALIMITALSFMLRQHYALTLQDRLIEMEMRFRIFTEFTDEHESLFNALSKSQLFALRFAPKEEFKLLTRRAIEEKLSGTDIKKAIKNWKADYSRV